MGDMKTADKILGLLEESRGKAISGERIAEVLGISRAAVWKHMKALKEEGYEISSVSNKGYELMDNGDVFSAKSVIDELADGENGYKGKIKIEAEVRDEVTSTNALLKDMAAAGIDEGRVLIAKRQTEGRGRLGRNFFSPKNGIYLSMLLRPDMDFREAMLLTTIAAVAVVEAVREVTGKDTGIKWVNDVYLDGKKICGILTEAVTDVENGRLSYAVVGIGINITKPSDENFPEELRDIAGFVYDEEEPPKGVMSKLSAAIVKNYFKYYEKLPEHDFMESYKKYQTLLNKEIFVITPDGSKKAKVLGVDDEARLLVKYEDGKSEALFTGEVSVREAGSEKENMPRFKNC
ncbi:MAG: biotin--[acetyl-CoA-carboxylase] ligase [Catonella sp.]|uniref:biotin--[acetyl-CoA-carboxylase] ligase n=1 Tax=Catonella sp. TaxID=2382125 RepID=UPI003FA05813